MWEMSQRMLREVVESLDMPFYEAEGEAAFYGPKLDVQIRTALGKEETLSTVQLDFLLPERFELEYVGDDGQKHRPVVIHRGILGTMERFTAFLLENFAGALPLWLSPVQVKVIPVSNAFEDYAKEVAEKLQFAGISVEPDLRNEAGLQDSGSAAREDSLHVHRWREREKCGRGFRSQTRRRDIGAQPLDEIILKLREEINTHVV